MSEIAALPQSNIFHTTPLQEVSIPQFPLPRLAACVMWDKAAGDTATTYFRGAGFSKCVH